jgi:hypothetical protein
VFPALSLGQTYADVDYKKKGVNYSKALHCFLLPGKVDAVEWMVTYAASSQRGRAHAGRHTEASGEIATIKRVRRRAREDKVFRHFCLYFVSFI